MDAARSQIDAALQTIGLLIIIMHITQDRSCWGVARVALVLFFVTLGLFYLFGGFDPAAVQLTGSVARGS